MSTISIKKNIDLQVSSKISEYLNPDFCYVPIPNNSKLLVNINDRILKNQPILQNEDEYVISSPISGKIIAVEIVNTLNGKMQAFAIKNDYKEKNYISKGVNNDFTRYNNINLNNLMKSCGVTYYDDKNDFFHFNSKKPKYLLIDAFENEPYIANFSILLKTKIEEILESADDLSRLLGIDKVFLAIGDYETDVISDLINMLGTFPNFELKLISNSYPANIYKSLPVSINKDDILSLNLTTLSVIDKALKKERNVTTKLITVTGDLINKPKVISVKIGSNLNQIISNNFTIKSSSNSLFVINGLLNGYQVQDLDMIVTPDIKSVMIMEAVSFEEKDCLNCGACIKVCPDKFNIKYISDNINNIKNNSLINDPTNYSACTYICPANKNFFSIFSKDNRKKNKIILHSDNSITKINYQYLIALLPLILFGFYKNGIIVFQNHLATTISLFYPLLIPFICFIIGYFVTFYINKYLYKKSGKILDNYLLPIQTLMIGMLMPVEINLFVCFGIVTLFSFIYFYFFYQKKISINFIALTTIIIFLLSTLIFNTELSSNLYLNNYEKIANFNPSIIRLLFGYNYSGLATSNIILIFISYLFLSRSISYKKEIPFYTLLFYIIFSIVGLLFTNNFDVMIRNILSSSFIFLITFVASDLKSSPYNRLGMIVYSLFVAILSYLLSFINYELSLFVAIFIVSLFTNLINKIFRKTRF